MQSQYIVLNNGVGVDIHKARRCGPLEHGGDQLDAVKIVRVREQRALGAANQISHAIRIKCDNAQVCVTEAMHKRLGFGRLVMLHKQRKAQARTVLWRSKSQNRGFAR